MSRAEQAEERRSPNRAAVAERDRRIREAAAREPELTAVQLGRRFGTSASTAARALRAGAVVHHDGSL